MGRVPHIENEWEQSHCCLPDRCRIASRVSKLTSLQKKHVQQALSALVPTSKPAAESDTLKELRARMKSLEVEERSDIFERWLFSRQVG